MVESCQPYQVIQRIDDIEYRAYPAAAFAQVHVRGAYVTRLNSGFRELSHYVTGGNAQHQIIPLNMPIMMAPATPHDFVVRCYLSDCIDVTMLPLPLSDAVEIITRPATVVASIMLSDSLSASSMEYTAHRLLTTLATKGIHCTTTPEYYFYTAPWQLYCRRGGVSVRLIHPPIPFL